MNEIQKTITSVQCSKAKDFEMTAEAFARSRFMVRSSEYGENVDEMEALQKIADGIKCRVEQSDSGISQAIDFDDNDRGNYLEVIEEGMSAPLTGGDNGIVTEPDGSTRQSNVPERLWGNPIEEYSKQGSEILEEIRMMLQDLFRTYIQELISDSRSELVNIARNYVVQELQKLS